MFKQCVLMAVVASAGVLCGLQGKAQAQDFPPLGVDNLWQMNQQFEDQFNSWAWRQSVDIARHMQPGERLPFHATTISHSISESNDAFDGYRHSLQNNSLRTDETLRRFDQHIRDVGGYGDSEHGPLYELPYTHDVWNLNPDTQIITPGEMSGHINLYP
jgi:hypothetical protein